MVILLRAQPSIGIEVALVSVLVSNAVFLFTAAGGGQCQFQAVFILVGSRGFPEEIVLRSVGVFPDIVIAVGAPGINPLVEVGPPAVTHTEGIV